MKSDREAKKILKAFGKEAYKERIKYVDSFLPEKTSFLGSISYRHTLRRVGMVALLVVLIMALAVSAYAAVMHSLNYTRIEHPTNDEYVANDNGSNEEAVFYEPTYVPEGYELESVECDDLFGDKDWIFRRSDTEVLEISQMTKETHFNIDNEHNTFDKFTIEDVEAVVYKSADEAICIFQYNGTVIIISGSISTEEIDKIIRGMI